MVKEFERFNKYLVLKQEDIADALNDEQKSNLIKILDSVSSYRWSKKGKAYQKYVVVNENESYSEIVWKLIEISQLRPEHMKDLINNILLEFDMEEHLGSAYI